MSKAELLGRRILESQDSDGHTIQVTHIRTDHGIASIRSEQPGMTKDDYFIVGGLVSGGSYEVGACAIAHLGHTGHTIRHGSNSIHGAIEADADEVVDIVEMLGRESQVHLIGHSKAGRVVLRVAARLDKRINVASVMLVNPALGATNKLEAARGVGGVLFEQAVVNLAHPFRMARAAKGAMHELRHRPLGVAGEALELLMPYDFTDDFKLIKDRGARTTLVIGSNDHLVTDEALEREAERYPFDETIRTDGVVDGGHFGVVASKDFLTRIIGPKAA